MNSHAWRVGNGHNVPYKKSEMQAPCQKTPPNYVTESALAEHQQTKSAAYCIYNWRPQQVRWQGANKPINVTE